MSGCRCSVPEWARDGDAIDGLTLCASTLIVLASGTHLSEVAPYAPGTRTFHDAMLEAARDLADSTWFTRAWVVQEALLPSRAAVYFGRVALRRELLRDAFAQPVTGQAATPTAAPHRVLLDDRVSWETSPVADEEDEG